MTLTKKELARRLLNGEKLTCDNGRTYCYYDENYSTVPFRTRDVNSNNSSWATDNKWNEIEWEVYTEPSIWWEPEVNKKKYTVESDGSITQSNTWDSTLEKAPVHQGNIFKTKREAVREAKWREAKYALKKAIFELNNKGWKPDWNGENSKYYVFYDSLVKKFSYLHTFYTKHHQDWFYLKSRELADKLIEEHENDLLVYLGVENEK